MLTGEAAGQIRALDLEVRIERVPQHDLGELAARREAPSRLLRNVVGIRVVAPDEEAGDRPGTEQRSNQRAVRVGLGLFVDGDVLQRLRPLPRADRGVLARRVADLGEQGILVARRTIAKYREALQIPPVNLRKAP